MFVSVLTVHQAKCAAKDGREHSIEAISAVRHEAMRIAGKQVDLDDRIEVRNPYNGAVVGSVPAGRAEHVRAAFAKGATFKPQLTRYERQQILLRTAELLRDRKEDFARLITAESGLCRKDSLYGRPRLRRYCSQTNHHNDEVNLFLRFSPQSKWQDINTRTPLRGVISAITPFNIRSTWCRTSGAGDCNQ